MSSLQTRKLFAKAGKLACAAVIFGGFTASAAEAHSRHHRHAAISREPASRDPQLANPDVACAARAVTAEAVRNKREDEAAVANTLKMNAQKDGSICAAAHRHGYHLASAASPSAVEAVKNVLYDGASWVPEHLRNATSFHAPGAGGYDRRLGWRRIDGCRKCNVYGVPKM